MGESLHEMARQLRAAAAECVAAVEVEAWEKAKAHARECLSAGSKVHARLAVMAELQDEARWRAAVDRALPKPAAQIDGQMTIADAIKAAKAKPQPVKPRTPRKREGKK